MIYVVRHGETEWNAINKVLGRTDMPLNAKGMEQAKEIARSLKCREGAVRTRLHRLRRRLKALLEKEGYIS